MATRLNPGSRSSWTAVALGTVFGVVVAGAALFGTALAVDDPDDPFELDGNIANASGVFGPPPTMDGKDDWQNVFNLSGVAAGSSGTPVANASEHELFIRDLADAQPNGKDVMYDAGKDSLDVTAWTRKSVNVVTPSKDDITDAFAKSYDVVKDWNNNGTTADDVAHTIIYFGLGKGVDNGDAAVGFWFFQKQLTETGTAGFGPSHTARDDSIGQRGDILVQADFVGGGAKSEIQIFEWLGNNPPPAGTPASDLFGGGTLLQLRFAANGSGPGACTSDDAACARTNNASIASFWPHTPKSGAANFYSAQTFFEGGIDLTLLAPGICINSFLANSRSAHSETADLKDLAYGEFATCGNIALVSKECKAVSGKSPLYLSASNEYQYVHDITIRNDGGGSSVYNVGLREDIVTGTAVNSNRCKITAITGGGGHALSLPYQIPNNTAFTEVASTLAPGAANQMVVTVECISPMKELHNAASVRAGQVPGGTSLSDSIAAVDNDFAACETPFPAALTITKSCKGDVVLDAANDYKPKVCVEYVITNTSGSAGSGTVAQKIDVLTLDDIRLDGTSEDISTLLPDKVLDVNESNTISDCYSPKAPDNGQTNADLVTYSDSATITARGKADPTLIEKDSNTASCELCPVGQR